MFSSHNIRDFLHDVLANKARSKLTTDEFNQLMNTADQIQKFSEKGLFIVTMSEQLLKMSNVNFSAIKKFMNEFLNGLKPQKVRRERQEGEARRRRPRPAGPSRKGQNINVMVQESVSNPSNLEMPRFGTDVMGPETQSNKFSENGSKKSEENKRDIEFANQLNKISQGIEFVTNQELEHNHQIQMEQISKASSSSSSQSFGLVSNLSQKLDLLNRRDEKPQKKTKAVQRTGAKVTTTATKRKPVKKVMLDENLTLQKTKATMADTTFEEGSLSFVQPEWIDVYQQNQQHMIQTEEQFEEKAKEKKLSMLSNLMLSVKKEGRREMHEQIPQELTQFDTGLGEYGDTIHDFTSQQMPEFSQQPDMAPSLQMSDLSIFNYEEANPTLAEISMKVNRPEALVFYEMLAKMQKGEIEMTQEDVTDFSEIRVELLSQN